MVLTRLRGMIARDERGTAAMEFALLLPVMMLVLLGAIDFGRFAYAAISVGNAARAAAAACVYASDAACDSGDPFILAAIRQYATQEASYLDATKFVPAPLVDDTAVGAGCPCLTVTVWYQFSTLVPWPGIPGGPGNPVITAATARVGRNIEAP